MVPLYFSFQWKCVTGIVQCEESAQARPSTYIIQMFGVRSKKCFNQYLMSRSGAREDILVTIPSSRILL